MAALTPTSLRGRLALLLLGAFGVILGMAIWFSLERRDEQLTAPEENLRRTVALIIAQQQGMIGHVHQLLATLAQLPHLRPDRAPDECARVLSRVAKSDVPFFNIGLANLNGDVVCMARPPAVSLNIADRAYFQQALRTRDIVVSDALETRGTPGRIIAFANGIRDDAEQALGVLFAALDLSGLNRELAKASLPANSRLLLVDSRGVVLVHYPDPEKLVGASIAERPLFKRVTARNEGAIDEVGPGGMRRIFAFAPFADTTGGRIYLLVGIPRSIVTAELEREFIWALIISLTVLLGTLGALWIGGERWFLRPLGMLAHATRRLGVGDLAARSGLGHADNELGQVARAFDHMADAVESKDRELTRVNRALRVVSAGNRTLLHATDEPTLLNEMCRAIVEAGGYRRAWVGYAEHDARKSIRPAAGRGAAGGAFLEELELSWGNGESSDSPAGAAIRRGVPVAVQNIGVHAGFERWKEHAQRGGINACLALPLRVNGAVIGTLNLCSAEPDAFSEEEIELLSEAAADLSFGIANQREREERKRLDARATDAEGRFRAAAEANIDALFFLSSVRDAGGRITDFEFMYVNARGAELVRMERSEIVGQKLCELMPINRTGGFFDKYVAVATTGEPLEEQFSFEFPDLGTRWLRHQVVKLGDGVAISTRDVTEWKEAAEKSQRLSRHNELILGAAGEGILGVDAEGRITFINPAGATMLGWRAQDLVGQVAHGIYHHTKTDGTSYPQEECPVYAAFRDGHTHRVDDEVFWRKDGTNFPVEYTSTPIRDEDGRLVGAVTTFSDITERNANETALLRANRALKTLSAVNLELVRATNEPQLLQGACRIIVEEGGYRMAWVEGADDNSGTSVTPTARFGIDADALQNLRVTPIIQAIRSGETQVVHDIRTDPRFTSSRELLLANDCRSNIVLPLVVEGKVIGGLSIYAREANAFEFATEELNLLRELCNGLAFGIETLRAKAERDRIAYAHEHHAEILRKSLEDAILAIAATVEIRDPYTAGHQRRVAKLAVEIAQELGLTEERIHGLHLAGIVHDLGKIQVPAEILSKPGRLSEVEFMLIQTHPQAGYEILKDVEFPWPIAEIVRQHHEKLDGSGYPQGLKGARILLEARIMTVADVVEAMASHRPYRAALGIESALKEIQRGRGTAYDADAVDACVRLFTEKGLKLE